MGSRSIRGMRQATAFGIAAVALATPALAQTANPNSRQNVVPAVSSSGAASLEAERKRLFAEMLKNPADLDTAFKYSELSVRVGDLESAISTLERMLIFAPGLPRLQYELGVLYYRLGAYDTAQSYFQAVLASPNVPDDIRERIGTFTAGIEERSDGSTLAGVVTVGVRGQTNANAGPRDDTITIIGLPFTLDEDSTSQPDLNGFVSAALSGSWDLAGQGDRFDATLTGYGALYANQTDLHTGVVELKAGPSFNLERFDWDNARLGVYGIASGAVLGGDPYYGALGLGASVTKLLDARTRLIWTGEWRYESFADTDARPTSSQRDGNSFAVSGTAEHKLTQDVAVFGTVDGKRKHAEVDRLNTWSAGASVGVKWSFDCPGEVADPWILSGSVGVVYTIADVADPVFSTERQETEKAFVQAAVTVPVADQIAVQAAASYTVSESNYDIGDYDNLAGSLGVSKRF